VTILVTGGTGFIGRALCKALAADGADVRVAARRDATIGAGTVVNVGELGGNTDWSKALDGVDLIYHLAGVTHRVSRREQESADYERVNVDGTAGLAQAAARAGVKRLVFLSTSKVSGESSEKPLRESDPPQPHGPYAESKWRAEQRLHEAAAASALEVTIVRPPLVYGPHVKANFLTLMRAVDWPLPLPIAGINNRRSMIFVENLADALRIVGHHPAAAGQVFFVKDAEDLSTPELTQRLAKLMKRRPLLFSAPTTLLRFGARIAGRPQAWDKMAGCFVLDDTKVRTTLGWRPPHGVDESLAATVAWYRASRNA
jgi:nucleoside-diphosphate-sugar epimerase